MAYRRIASILIVLAFILPVLSTLPAVVPAQGAIAIVSAPSYVYPGEPVTVEVDVGFAAPFTIYLMSSANQSTIWASQTIYPPTPGRYNITLILPKKLPDIGTPATLLIEAEMPALGAIDYRYVDIYPKIEVAPRATTIVDNYGNPKVVTVYGYGFDDGAVITSIDFIGPSNSSKNVSITVGNDGTFTATVDLLNDLQSHEGLARGTYAVNVTTDTTYASEIKTGTLQINPQIIVSPNSGNGRCDSSYCELANLTIEGYGFGANTRILKVEFINTNFSNVVYVFKFDNPPVLTDEYGYFNVSNLANYMETNLTAGMYIFRVYEEPPTNASAPIEFEFRGTYYLVRPELIQLTREPLKPGDTVTIVAYGYGPGEAWGYNGKNTLHVSFDKVKFLGNFSLGKDGNVTFTITIPNDATYGAHYIWAVDDWGYEYSLAIIIGARAFWAVVNGTTGAIIANNVVSAGLDNKRVEVCPCNTYKASTFCDKCVVYGGACDYLGDIIRVFIAGLSPNETVDIYFGDIKVAEAKADASGVVNTTFVVPTVPEGDYLISAEASISGNITFVWFNGTDFLPYKVHVAPKILLLTLTGNYTPVLVGSGIVRVIGTGFTPGVAITGVLINGTDALLSFNTNVQRWTADANGVLYSPFSKNLGLFIPVLQPGKYEITLTYIKGNNSFESLAGVVYVVNNLTNVATRDQLAGLATKEDLETAKQAILVAINNVAGTIVSSISRSIDSLAMSVDDVLSEIKVTRATLLASIISVNETVKKIGNTQVSVDLTPVLSAINDLKGKVDSLGNKVDTVAGKVDSVSSSISTLSGKIDSLSAKVDSLSSKVDSVSSKVDSATNSIIGSISQVANKVAIIEGKTSAIASGVSEISGKADAIFYESIAIAILALLAMIFAVLAYSTIKKSIAPAAK